jgi:hypothetical protein
MDWIAPDSLALDKPVSSRQLAVLELCKPAVQPGDIVLVATPGIFYSAMRTFTKHPADHALVVLPEQLVFHVSPGRIRMLPLARILDPIRSPLLIRPAISTQQNQQLVTLLRTFIGKKYDLPRVYDAIFR